MLLEGNTNYFAPQAEGLKKKIEKLLFEVNKPSRYTGKEIGSLNKDWDSAAVKTAIAFPDMYEIGVSNLGHRILYSIINNYKNENYLGDRVYAPETDFKNKLQENNLPLYGVESFKPLSEFDIIAFSLQYELSYPTILSMLEMGRIPLKVSERNENHPLIIAGGPGSYNPEPLTDFIDAFIIGDGEEVLIEILNTVKKGKDDKITKKALLKELSKIEGIYIPEFYNTNNEFKKPIAIDNEVLTEINKRISNLAIENTPVDFPVPYISTVHDRAVAEIRRGCGRMCRFCQSCFVNLPVREKDSEDVIKIVNELLQNTGYDEYSLLSLSSSDYTNIVELVCNLNKKHAETGASISLPSQRADAFSLELANEVQSVRKSTITFAPEAGSQRLRNVINKNLTEQQIMDAIFSTYKAGWTSVKLYFMIGLPTETYEDLDEIINLIQKIKDKAKELKFSLNLKKHLDITCTMSIFVPKPFTPFQWCPQDSLQTIDEKTRYLRDKVKGLRGVKLNFHDSFLSQLEAVFARGDRSLNNLIELVYKKGSYLDAWSEHFNKGIWYQAASELNMEFENYSTKQLPIDIELPWDIINIGVEKNWLKQEYKKALENQASIPCDESCASCGVCKTYNKKPVINSTIPEKVSQKGLNEDSSKKETFKYRLSIVKKDNLKYISHLDWHRLLYRAFRKANIKLDFSGMYNPSPKISIGIALPLFVESLNEYVDIELKESLQEDILLQKLNSFLPENSKIIKTVRLEKGTDSIDKSVCWAKYTATVADEDLMNKINLEEIIEKIKASDSLFIEKKTKKGSLQKVDIKPALYNINQKSLTVLEFILKTGQGEVCCTNSGEKVSSLRADQFLECVTPNIRWNVTREKLLDSNFKELI